MSFLERKSGLSMESKHYTIKIIPDDGGDVHSIHLPAPLLKYGLLSLALGLCLFVGAFGYAVYESFRAHSNAGEIAELRKVNNIQQEQLLQLAKKAGALQDGMEQLLELENNLRRMAGTGAAADTDESKTENAPSNGQGGPIFSPDTGEVERTLTATEKKFEKRKASLAELEETIKTQRREMQFFGLVGGVNIPGIASTTPSIWPTSGDVSSPYGLRWNGSDFHPGIDIANDMGTPIVATADGIVDYAGWNAGGYGNMVDIDHGGGVMTRYAHASQVVVTAGQSVRRGQLIAYMGSTGFSTGPHVHYEVRIDGQAVNPISYMR